MRLPKFMSGRMMRLALSTCLVLSAAACTTTNGVTTTNTAEISADANVVLAVVQDIMNVDVIKGHMTAAQLEQVDKILSNIQQVNSQIASSSNGAIAVNTSSEWAKSIFEDLQTFLGIAQPIVQQYDPTVATYITEASALLPFLQTIVSNATNGKVAAHYMSVSDQAAVAQLRAKLYLGPQG